MSTSIKSLKVPMYAIDAPGTRDRDDAIGYDGQFCYVAIADVQVEDELIAELAARPETRYLPSRHLPMLPPEVETKRSLHPARQEAWLLSMTPQGDFAAIERANVRVQIMNYEEAAESRIPDLLSMREIASQSRRQEYDFEGGWASIEGTVRQLSKHERNDGFVLIMELMVLANRAIATWMQAEKIPGVFRNHGPTRHDHAEYGLSASGHVGLALPCYTHATSPLRRLADLVNWRQIRAHINKKEPIAIETLCDKINSYYQSQRDNDSNKEKQRVVNKAAREHSALDVSAVARSKDFLNLLRACVDLTPNMRAAILQRRDEKLLAIKERAHILFVKRWMLDDLTSDEADYISVLKHAEMSGLIGSHEFSFNTPEFVCTATMGDKIGRGNGASKQEAQSKAARQLTALLTAPPPPARSP